MRLVLLKSQKFANQAGYYLLNGRWHKTSQDKPAPKGAPVSAHPHAAGKPVAKPTLQEHEWGQLKLPAENVNAKTFNKQLDQLKAAAAAGDITGIVGSGYGTNTYGKKLVIIANHILGLLGSDHKVTPGQKAGTHAAVQTAPEIQAEAPAPKPEPAPEVKPEPKAEPKPEPKEEPKPAAAPEKKADAELAVPEFAEGKQAKGVKSHYEKVAKKVIRAAKAGDLSALQFMIKPESGNTWKGKTDNSKKLLALHQEAISYAQKNQPAGKDIQHPDAEKQAAQEAKDLAKEQITQEKNDSGEPEINALQISPEQFKKLTSTFDKIDYSGPLASAANVALKKMGNTEAAYDVVYQAIVESNWGADEPVAQAISNQKMKKFGVGAGGFTPVEQKPLPDSNDMADVVSLLDSVSGSLEAGHEASKLVKQWGSTPEAYDAAFTALNEVGYKDVAKKLSEKKEKAHGKPAQKFTPVQVEKKEKPSEEKAFDSNTGGDFNEYQYMLEGLPHGGQADKAEALTKDYLSKSKDANKEQKASEALKEYGYDDLAANLSSGNKPTAESGPKEGETKQGADGTLVFKNGRWHKQAEAAKAEPKPAAKEQPKGDASGKLSQIPWDGMLLPDSNKNAKSHNKQVAKIKAMAEAGDIEGLKNFKAGVNTYGKKQNLLAQTALAALEESAPASKAEKPKDELFSGMAKPPEFKDKAEFVKWFWGNGYEAMEKEGIQKYGSVAAWNASPEVAYLDTLSEKYEGVDGSANPAPADKPKAAAPAADGLPPKPAHADKWTDTVNALEGWAKSGDLTEAESMYYDLFSLVDEMPDAMPVLHYAQDVVAHIKKAGAEQDGKPQKPTGLTSVHWSSTVDEIETAMQAGNEPYLMNMVQQTAGLQSAEAKAVHDYAVSAAGYVQDQKQASSASTENDGPQEGETKQGSDGMLVFKNGRWHKMGEDKAPADKAAAEKPAPAGPADVEIPTFTGLSPNHTNSMNKAAAALKAKIVAEGKAGFKGVLTNHKDGKVTVQIDGIKIGKASVTSSSPAFSAFAKFVDELKASTGAQKKAKPTPKPKAEPAPAPEPSKQLESMDGWTQTGGQGGSNPGGKFKDENGVEWYCKFPENDHIAKAEVLAAKLYSALGLNAQDAKLVTKDGKVGIASRWVNVKKASPKELAQTPGVLAGFAADAWLANWDVVGLAYDNLQVDDQGHAMRVDAGGSLMYRAQGSKKAFENHVTELDSLRDPKINPQAAAVFGNMTDADIAASVAKVAQISDAQIRLIVSANGPGDKAEKKALADTLIARKNDLLAKYPQAAKAKKKRLDPENLPVKEERLPKIHDFANWNGQGAGLSSKAAVNNANQQVESEMLAIAKAGNLTKLKEYKFQPVDIATGEPKGEPVPVAQHPSKHVQQFHQDLIQALDEIANPPQPLKIFQETDLNTLEELETAFPPKKFGTTVNAVHSNEKMGFWVVLGGVHGAAEKFMPKKISHFTTAAIDAAYVKFKEASALARHFILSVQASGSYNDLFREGKEKDSSGNKLSDVAKAALEYATEQPEGTTVYRWQNMSKDMVDKIMGAPDGTVFQATGPMCTSMSPTATSHFGPHRIKISYAKGAKAVESFGSGKFPNEKEITTLPNSRFVILKKEMVPGAGGSKRLELEVLMLPPDIGL